MYFRKEEEQILRESKNLAEQKKELEEKLKREFGDKSLGVIIITDEVLFDSERAEILDLKSSPY